MDTLYEALEPTVEGLGFELWGLERDRDRQGIILRLFIDSKSGIKITDCEVVSHQVSDLLLAEELISGEFRLEVSSPGFDRRFFKNSQYFSYLGESLNIRLYSPKNGQRNFKGVLLGVSKNWIIIEEDSGSVKIEFSEIERSQLKTKVS